MKSLSREFTPQSFLFLPLWLFLWLVKCSIDQQSWGPRSEGAVFITGWEEHAGRFTSCPSFHWKTININLWNASVWYKSTSEPGGGARADLPSCSRVELEYLSSLGFADIWGEKKSTFSKGRPANHCQKCRIGALKWERGCEGFGGAPSAMQRDLGYS